MPLLSGNSDEIIARNIARLIEEGYSPEQATAIAHHHAFPDRRADTSELRAARARAQDKPSLFGDARLPDRFWGKTTRCDKSTCWLWGAHLDRDGYAQYRDGDRIAQAHRTSYEAFTGAIGDGMELDHLCKTRRCVNPTHLELVSPAENKTRRYDDEESDRRRARAKVQLAQRRAVLPSQRAGGRFLAGHRSPRPIPRAAPPTAVAVSYGSQLRGVVADVRRSLADAIRLAGTGRADQVHHALSRAREQAVPPEHVMHHRLQLVAKQADAFSERQLGRQLKAGLGVELDAGQLSRGMTDRFVARNASLVRSLAGRAHDEAAQAIHDGIRDGKTHEEIAADVAERLDVAEGRAALIADNEVGQFAKEASIERQQALGLERGRYRTAGDNRVRDEHRALEGTEHALDDPPPELDEINCRCVLDPVLDDLGS